MSILIGCVNIITASFLITESVRFITLADFDNHMCAETGAVV